MKKSILIIASIIAIAIVIYNNVDMKGLMGTDYVQYEREMIQSGQMKSTESIYFNK